MSQGFTRQSFSGTASYAHFATSASWADTASYAFTASVALTASYVASASFSQTSSLVATSASFAISASYAFTASQANLALFIVSASHATNSISSSYSLNSISSSYAISSSYSLNSNSSSYSLNSNSASYTLNSNSSSYTTTGSFAYRLVGGAVNVKEFGAVGDNVTDDTTAMQNAFNFAESGGYEVYIPKGTYRISSSLKNLTGIYSDTGASLHFMSTGSACLTLGTGSDYTELKTYVLPNITANTVYGTGSIGVELINVYKSKITTNRIQYFETGMKLTAVNAGCVHNQFYLGEFWTNKVQLLLNVTRSAVNTGSLTDRSGWVNENTFYGGSFSHTVIGGLMLRPGFHHVKSVGDITTGSGNTNNNNRFIASSFEWVVPAIDIELTHSTDFFFEDCRWEKISSTGSTIACSGSNYIYVNGGYFVDFVRINNVGGTQYFFAQKDGIQSGLKKSTGAGGNLGHPTIQLQNTWGNSNSVIQVVGSTQNIYTNFVDDAAPSWSFQVCGDRIEHKEITAPSYQLKFKDKEGIYFGNGSGSVWARVSSSATNKLDIDSNLFVNGSITGSKANLKTSGPTTLVISGSGANYHNGAVIFDGGNDAANVRAMGNYYHDTVGSNEWFVGRPYNAGVSRFVIAHSQSGVTHNDQTATYTNALLTINGTTGDVGIGTISPAEKLHIQGNVSASTVIASLRGTSSYSKTGSFSYRLVEGGVNVKEFGAMGDATTDDTTALQNAFNFANTGGYEIFFPKGTYRLLSPLKNLTGIYAENSASIQCEFSGAACLTLGTGSTYTLSKKWILPTINNIYLIPTGSIGIEVINVQKSEITTNRIGLFEVGLKLTGVGAGCVYNRILLGTFESNKIGIFLSSSRNSALSSGWVNENVFLGGAFTDTSGAPYLQQGHYHLKSLGDVSLSASVIGNTNNNNTFVCTSFEWIKPLVDIELSHSTDFHFNNCRWEKSGADTGSIISCSGSYNLILNGGYNSDYVTIRQTDGYQFFNAQKSSPAGGLKISNGSGFQSGHPTLQLRNTWNNLNPVIQIVGNTQNIFTNYNDNTKPSWSFQATSDMLEHKQVSATDYQLRLKDREGIFFGDGSGSYYSRISGSNSPTNRLKIENDLFVENDVTASRFSGILFSGSFVDTNGTASYIPKWDSTGKLIGSNLKDDGNDITFNKTGEIELIISGSGANLHNGAVVLDGGTDTPNARALGMYMHDQGGDNEWFVGRPYNAGVSRFVIAHSESVDHNAATATFTNALFSINGSTGNVGIGVTNPLTKLHVNGHISASAITASLFGSSSYALSSSNARSASYSITSSFSTTAITSTSTTSASYSVSSSLSNNSIKLGEVPRWHFQGTGNYFVTGSDQVGYIYLGDVAVVGTYEVTIFGGYTFGNAYGKLTKRYALQHSSGSTTFEYNSSEVVDAYGPISINYALGELEMSASVPRIPIYQLPDAAWSNQIFVYIDLYISSVDQRPTAFNSITIDASGSTVVNSYTRNHLSYYRSDLILQTGSFIATNGGFTGSLLGNVNGNATTATTATTSTSASYASTASFWNSSSIITLIGTKQDTLVANNLYPISTSYAHTASFWNSSSIITLIGTKQDTLVANALYDISSSYAKTASFWNSSSIITLIGTKQDTLVANALYDISSSYAKTASLFNGEYVKTISSGTNITVSGGTGVASTPSVDLNNQISLTGITASLKGTSSWASNATYAATAGDATTIDLYTASDIFNSSNQNNGTLPTGRLSGTYLITSSWANNFAGNIAASQIASGIIDSSRLNGYYADVSASYAKTASYVPGISDTVSGYSLLTSKATHLTGAAATGLSYNTLLVDIRSGTSTTVGADTLNNGKILELECNGKMRGSDGYAPKLRLKIGSSYTREITIGENESNSHPVAGVPWNAFFSLLIDTAGASPTTSSMGFIDVQNTPDGGSWYSMRSMPAESGTVDTTTSNVISLEYYGHANMLFFSCNTVKMKII